MPKDQTENIITRTTLLLLRAQDIGDKHAPKLTIHVLDRMPSFKTLEEHREVFSNQAKMLSDALFASLPGGTMDALFAEMAKHYSSLFVIPHSTSGTREDLNNGI